MQNQLFAWLRPTFGLAYTNPLNAVIVPYGTTRVVLDSEPLADGRFSVQVRASILMDLEPSDDLVVYVALNGNDFHFGNLYLFPEGDRFDLDYANKVLNTWVDAPGVVELVVAAADNATAAAQELQPRFGGRVPNPSGRTRRNTFIGTESTGRHDVWEALDNALDTPRCLILGTADHVELSGIGALTEGWFVVSTEFIWLAGRDHRTRAITLWRVPHRDIHDDGVATEVGRPTYTARLVSGTRLSVVTATEEAAAALRDTHRDPREPDAS